MRPIIPGFFPDPSVCRAGDTYWLACSTFEYAPGVPLFRSTDLRSWDQVGNVLAHPSQLDVSRATPSGGVLAPTLRHHDGRFWMITTNFTDGGGQVLTWADDPAGEWADPIRLPGVIGFDPDLTWDDDGTCYLTYSGYGAGGHLGIVQQLFDLEKGVVLGEQRRLWNGTGGKSPEGPHLYRIGEYWYLLIAEGGTERGHAATIARATSPAGPFEPCPDNPILTARGTDAPVQSTGHADLVQRADGTWAIVYHGVRPRGGTPQWHVLGRETFAAEVEWVDGWPRIGAPIEPDEASVAASDELAGDILPASWVAPFGFPESVFTRTPEGWRLRAQGPVLVGRRQQHLSATARVVVDPTGGVGGASIWIDPRHRLDLEVTDGRVRAIAHVGELTTVLGEAPLTDPGRATLELRAVPNDVATYLPGGAAPDHVAAGVVDGEEFTELGRLDGRYLSTEVAGGFTGRLFGCWAEQGSILVRSFTYCGTVARQ
ncbi:glycoside hydrolase family 43 protein [Cryptosporangium aurantiacum]|uniref:Beta-xylosidase n=1 Tax=Cryptosporangium aurantiacum TaxID=134849 RepID=A0A1M7PDR3_9ACTN|nr:glycoside hydrolase family 43 protein [Cryptosporangium aurantiacum]SHN14631.1 Beta-xylosidase [Cryptosporangium aurantiacum]